MSSKPKWQAAQRVSAECNDDHKRINRPQNEMTNMNCVRASRKITFRKTLVTHTHFSQLLCENRPLWNVEKENDENHEQEISKRICIHLTRLQPNPLL